jgi:hypothetical protein
VLTRVARGGSLADKSRPLIVARRVVEAICLLGLWYSWNSIRRLQWLLILTDAGFRLLQVKNLESGVHEDVAGALWRRVAPPEESGV